MELYPFDRSLRTCWRLQRVVLNYLIKDCQSLRCLTWVVTVEYVDLPGWIEGLAGWVKLVARFIMLDPPVKFVSY